MVLLGVGMFDRMNVIYSRFVGSRNSKMIWRNPVRKKSQSLFVLRMSRGPAVFRCESADFCLNRWIQQKETLANVMLMSA